MSARDCPFCCRRWPRTEQLKLIVVGGEADLIARYRQEAAKYQLGNRVKFVGMQSDVRPYLWSSDVFVFPSLYETFSLVTYEAAASGLPIVASHLYGVEDLLKDGDNGFLIETTVGGVTRGAGACPEPEPGRPPRHGPTSPAGSFRLLRRALCRCLAGLLLPAHGGLIYKVSLTVSFCVRTGSVRGIAAWCLKLDCVTARGHGWAEPSRTRCLEESSPQKPSVSVLITCFNYGAYVGQAIESVLAQTYPPAEIIVSDDASQDNSCEVVESYISRGYGIRLLRNPHGGMAANLNAAYRKLFGGFDLPARCG